MRIGAAVHHEFWNRGKARGVVFRHGAGIGGGVYCPATRRALLECVRAWLTLAGVVESETLQRGPRDVAMSRFLE
jgi:hypothetical protein